MRIVKSIEETAWEQLEKMDGKMLDALLAGVCTDVEQEKYDCVEEIREQIYLYLMEAHGCKTAEELELFLGECVVYDTLAEVLDGNYCEFLNNILGIKVIIEYRYDEKSGRCVIFVKEDEPEKTEHVQMVEKYYSKTDDCAEMQARVYEYMKMALGVDNKYAVEEHIYACFKAGTWEDRMREIGLKEYLESIADAPYRLEYYMEEESGVVYEKDKEGKVTWEYEFGPRTELYVLAPSEHLEVMSESDEDGYYTWCIVVDEPDFVETDEVVPAAPAAPQRPDDDDLPF